MHTILRIAEYGDVPRRSFKAFRTLRPALSFLGKRAEDTATLRVCHYTNNEKDVRYIVNYIVGELAPKIQS